MKSGVRQQYPSRQAVLDYFQQSPNASEAERSNLSVPQP
jgi:hypothetical protein